MVLCWRAASAVTITPMLDDSSLPDHPEVKDFVARATSPAAWRSHAEWLVGSSEVLWQQINSHFDDGASALDATRRPDTSHGPAFLLLVGFALEAMLKAAALQVELNVGGVDRVVVQQPTPRVHAWLKTHRLEAIAQRASIAYAGDELLYLRRFEKHLKWAGRYPVPLAPELDAPRGFDHQIGVQDRAAGHALLQRAREAYEHAKTAAGAWVERDSIGDYHDREAEWMAASTEWLRVVRPTLIRHAIQMGRGDRGVMHLSVDTSEIRSQLAGPSIIVRLDPVWLPTDEFLAIVGHRDGVGRETARRWADSLGAMDPLRDAALFLSSRPDGDGRWFSRYIFLKAPLSRSEA